MVVGKGEDADRDKGGPAKKPPEAALKEPEKFIRIRKPGTSLVQWLRLLQGVQVQSLVGELRSHMPGKKKKKKKK